MLKVRKITKTQVNEIKDILNDIFNTQQDLDEVLQYLLRYINKPEFVEDKVIIINDLFEDLKISYDNLLKICIELYLKHPKL